MSTSKGRLKLNIPGSAHCAALLRLLCVCVHVFKNNRYTTYLSGSLKVNTVKMFWSTTEVVNSTNLCLSEQKTPVITVILFNYNVHFILRVFFSSIK